MKAEVALGLENAGWPVLLVNSSGAILRANPAAVQAFGSTLEGEMPLSAIWASEKRPDGRTVHFEMGQLALPSRSA